MKMSANKVNKFAEKQSVKYMKSTD